MKSKILLLLIVSALFISCTNYGKKISKNKTVIYYTDGATVEEAQKLLDYLVESVFTDGNGKSVQLVKDEETNNLIFKMVVGEDVYNSTDYDNVFSVFPANLSKAFNGAPIDVHITDDSFETKKIFLFKDSQESIMALKTEVRYTAEITKEEAQRLVEYLIKEEFADNETPKTVLLDKDGEVYQFKMVVGDSNVTEETTLLLKEFGVSLSNDVFNNSEVEMHACDDNLKSIKVVKQ